MHHRVIFNSSILYLIWFYFFATLHILAYLITPIFRNFTTFLVIIFHASLNFKLTLVLCVFIKCNKLLTRQWNITIYIWLKVSNIFSIQTLVIARNLNFFAETIFLECLSSLQVQQVTHVLCSFTHWSYPWWYNKKVDDDTGGWKRKIKRSDCMTSGLNEFGELLAKT